MKDEFDDLIEEQQKDDSSEVSNKERVNNVFAYIPFFNFKFFFIEDKTLSQRTKRHIKQGVLLTLFWIFFTIILSFTFFFFVTLFFLLYLFLAAFLAVKAYSGDYIKVPLIEDIINSFDKKK